MERREIECVVEAVMIALERITQKTRTPTDDLMVAFLRSSQKRFVEAIASLPLNAEQGPSEDEIVAALKNVGIKV